MKIGIADYGMNVWDGGCFDLEARLLRLNQIGYQGIERLEAISADHAVQQAVCFRKTGMDFGTCRGPNPEVSILWAAAFGKSYVWTMVDAGELDVYCRQARLQAEACTRYGIRVGVHNHLGSPVESQAEVEEFLKQCPQCGLILDTGHLAAAGGDPVGIIRRYADRLLVIHVKDWFVTNPEVGLDNWTNQGRFCELGAGNIGQDHVAVMRTLVEVGYDGWVFVEHDTHLRDPFEDLSISREYLRNAGV